MQQKQTMYRAARDAAEAAIREALRLAPNAAHAALWEAALGRAVTAGQAKPKPATTNRIRDLLGRAGLSQLAAARELGINPRTMRRYVLGQSAIPDDHLGRLEMLAEKRDGQ